jgi:hypothetical protein
MFVPTATASLHFDKSVSTCASGRTEKLLYVTEAETESACTFHDITEHYSSADVTLM